MALVTILTTVAGGVVSIAPSASRVQNQSVAETSAGYLRPPVLLNTVPSVLARHQAEVQATQVPEAPAPAAADAPLAEEATVSSSSPSPAYFTYTVQPGDNVYTVAAAFGVSADYIIWNNPGVAGNPDLLVVGATLLIPTGDALVYNVILGDSLNGIAEYYGSDVASILDANGLTSADTITPGMVLVIPGGSPPAPAPAAAVAAVVEEPPSEPDSEPAAVWAPEPDPVPLPLPPAAPSYGYVWPFYGVGISTYYSWGHAGIDIDGFGMHGAPVVATASGTVILASWDSWGYGYHVIIQHDDGSRSLYAHLSDIWVGQGSYVGQGQAVGAVGSTGYSTGTHLHFELHIGGPVDPLAYLP